jgi:predicted nucleic acid-binding protein
LILDASAAVDFVLDREPHAWVLEQLERAERVRAPHVIDAEVLAAIRRASIAGWISPERGTSALGDYAALRLIRFPHKPLMNRAWLLRDNVTAADGLYVALAEALGAPLVTTDASLARVPGLEIEVRAFA